MQISNVIDLLNNGFLNNPNAVVVNMGKIEVSHTEDGFVNLGGYIINHDSIISHDNIDYDLVNGGELDNLSGATIYLHSITSLGGVGYYNLGINSRIDNYGRIAITEIAETGILNEGQFFNYDYIDIYSLPGDAIVNNNYFQNLPNAQVEIDSVYGAGNSAFINSLSSSNLINNGTIKIDDIKSYGLLNHGVITNYNNITTSRTLNNGIDNWNIIHNETMGQINISNMVNAIAEGINNKSTADSIINKGKIYVTNIAGNGIENSGTFTNYDTISIRNCSTGILNKDSVYNAIDAWIIMDVTETGIDNNSLNSKWINIGKVTIPQSIKLGIRNFGFFYTDGPISIHISLDDGIQNNNKIHIDTMGTISLFSISSIGLYNGTADQIDIDGEISISYIGSGFINSGSLNISDQGSLHISNVYEDPMESFIGSQINCFGLLDISP